MSGESRYFHDWDEDDGATEEGWGITINQYKRAESAQERNVNDHDQS
jgi:hypothetical protein